MRPLFYEKFQGFRGVNPKNARKNRSIFAIKKLPKTNKNA